MSDFPKISASVSPNIIKDATFPQKITFGVVYTMKRVRKKRMRAEERATLRRHRAAGRYGCDCETIFVRRACREFTDGV